MAVKFGGGSGDHFSRTTALPDGTTLTVCLFASLSTDRNAFSTIWDIDNGTTNWILLGANTDGTSLVYSDDVITLSTGVSATVDTPFFLAFTKSGNSVTTYARLLTSSTMTTASGTGRTNPAVSTMYVGNDGFAEAWDGQVWGLKIWSGVALTAAEIYQESCMIRPARTANLHGWYPMLDSTVANSALDYSGNGRNWTNTGSNTIGQGGPVPWGGAGQTHSFATTSDVTVALSGTSITISQTAPGVSHTQGLTGGSLTSAAGTVTPATAIALAGGVLTSASGAMVPVKTVPMAGQVGTIAAGTLIATPAVALSGGSVTFSTGTLTAVGGTVSATITIKAGSWFRYRIVD